MKALANAEFPQAVIPSRERPYAPVLRRLGFSGSDEQVSGKVPRQTPHRLSSASFVSPIWVASATTVCPLADSPDEKVHPTMVNLNNKFHRSLKAPTTEASLWVIFRNRNNFAVHSTLPQVALFGGEGVANRNRPGGDHGDPGAQLSAYGREEDSASQPKHYPARQSRKASEAVARLNQVNPHQRISVRQNPDVIDLDVFHNDVITVPNHQVLFYHQQASIRQQALLEQLCNQVAGFTLLEIPTIEVSVQDAATTYLFNSQLLSHSSGSIMLILPQECREHAGVWWYLNRLLEKDDPIDDLRVFDLRENMSNGDGPTCLRLRAVLIPQKQQVMNPVVIMNDTLSSTLGSWAGRYYRDRLIAVGLADSQLLREGREMLDMLTQLLNPGSVYPFQQEEMHHE